MEDPDAAGALRFVVIWGRLRRRRRDLEGDDEALVTEYAKELAHELERALAEG